MNQFDSHWEMDDYESLQQDYQAKRKPSTPNFGGAKKPARKPTTPTTKRARSNGRGGAGHSVRNQPRDAEGKWTKGFKKFQKRVKKVRRTLSPTYHKRRVQRMRRTNQRAELRRQYGSNYATRPNQRVRRRAPIRKKVIQQRPLWRRLLGV